MYTSPVPFERVQGNRTVEFTISTAIRGSRYLIVEMRRGNQWLVRTTIIRISVAPFDGLFLRIAKLTVGCSFADFQHSTVEFGKIDVFCLSRDGFDRDVVRSTFPYLCFCAGLRKCFLGSNSDVWFA